MVEGAKPGAELELAPASQVNQMFRILAMAGPTGGTVFDWHPVGNRHDEHF